MQRAQDGNAIWKHGRKWAREPGSEAGGRRGSLTRLQGRGVVRSSAVADVERPRGWRGDGIHVRGGFRLRDFSLDLTTGEASFVPEVRGETWPHWLAIARDVEDQASSAREEAVEATDDSVFGEALEREFRASIQAVGASAFAIDAFYGATLVHAPAAKVASRAARYAKIFETLKQAYKLGRGQQQSYIRATLQQVFQFRDHAVHPPASWAKPVAHPVFGLGMEQLFVIFRAENAYAARKFAHQLIWRCLTQPKSRHRDLVTWCEATAKLIEQPDVGPRLPPAP